MKPGHLSIYHKGKLHPENSYELVALLGKSRLKFYVCQVCENFKPAELIYPALYMQLFYMIGYYRAQLVYQKEWKRLYFLIK